MRPKLEIEPDEFDKKIELIGIFLIIFIVLFSAYSYIVLPDTIPTHFNFKGEIDSYGSKFVMLFLPLIGGIMYFFLTFLNKKPHLFNFPIQITEENAKNKYTIATKMMRILKVELLFVFSTIEILTYFSVKNNVSSVFFWFLPIILIMVFGTVIYYLIKISKK